jgi:hypothetical protein
MGKKTFMAAIITLALLLSITAGTQDFSAVKANPKPFTLYIYFNSPLNTTYYTNSIVLNFSILKMEDCNNTIRNAWYSVDGQKKTSIELVYEGITADNGNALPHSDASGVTDLPPLPNGEHNVTVFGEYIYDTYRQGSNVTAIFDIMTNPSSKPSPTVTPLPIPLTVPSPSPS